MCAITVWFEVPPTAVYCTCLSGCKLAGEVFVPLSFLPLSCTLVLLSKLFACTASYRCNKAATPNVNSEKGACSPGQLLFTHAVCMQPCGLVGTDA